MILKIHARQVAKLVNLETQVTGVCLLILMGFVNIFALHQDIVGMEKLTTLVMIVVVVEL